MGINYSSCLVLAAEYICTRRCRYEYAPRHLSCNSNVIRNNSIPEVLRGKVVWMYRSVRAWNITLPHSVRQTIFNSRQKHVPWPHLTFLKYPSFLFTPVFLCFVYLSFYVSFTLSFLLFPLTLSQFSFLLVYTLISFSFIIDMDITLSTHSVFLSPLPLFLCLPNSLVVFPSLYPIIL